MGKHRRDPFRNVVEAEFHDENGTRIWVLRLECGHEDVRPVRYVSQGKLSRGGSRHNGAIRSVDDLQPAPKRVRCELCG